MAKKEVFICGNYGSGDQTTSGQVIKTRIVTEEIVNKIGSDNCTVFNTNRKIKSFLTIFFVIVPTMFRYKQVVVFPAQNGVLFLLPAFYLSKLLFRVKLHYVVIGGWLPTMIKNKPVLRSIATKYDYIYVETKTMEKALHEQGFSNVIIVPNVKKLKIVCNNDLQQCDTLPYKLCTFSRVMKQKGIEDVVNAVMEINNDSGKIVYELDIYGQVETQEIEWFNELKKRFPSYCRYKGIINSDESTSVIKDYFLLVFPTLFFTEGIPGTIIDAYASGVPVLSSRWESFADIIEEGQTGFGYKFGSFQELKEKLVTFSHNPSMVNNLKANCIQKAEHYKSTSVMNYLKLL